LSVLKIILTVLFVIVCLALAVIILLQEGKQSGLGAISGVADTYWGKNKGRSMEGKLEKGTKFLVIAFFVFAILLNINSIANPTTKSSTSNNNSTTNVTTKDAGVVDTTDDDKSDATDSQKDDAEDASDEAAE